MERRRTFYHVKGRWVGSEKPKIHIDSIFTKKRGLLSFGHKRYTYTMKLPLMLTVAAAMVVAPLSLLLPLAKAVPIAARYNNYFNVVLEDFAFVTVDLYAPPQERFAAEQLAYWLSQVSPANVSVVNVTLANASQEARPHFVVGAGAAAAAALPPSVAQQLVGKPEAFACRSSWIDGSTEMNGTASRSFVPPGPATLVLTGGVAQPRGTLNAVFDFLRQVGFRFWNAAHPNRTALITLPAPNVTVPACDRVFEPPIEYRLYNGWVVGAGDPLWRVQNHMSGAMDAEIPALPAEQGGGVGYVNGYFASTLYTLVPPEDHFHDHPEWYSYGCIHGNCTRRHEWKPGGPIPAARAGLGLGCTMAQLCLSNPTLRAFLVNQTLAAVAHLNDTNDRQHGTRPSIISISQNDCSAGSRCQCDKCLAMERSMGGMGGPFVALGNQVAAAVAARYPHMAVDNLAYTFTADSPNAHPFPSPGPPTPPSPPTPVAIGKNQIVRWAPIAVDQAYPLSTQRQVGMYSAQLAAEQLAGWSEAAKSGGGKLYAWVYYFNERFWMMPQPNWFNIVPDINLLAQSGVRGIFAEGVGSYATVEMDEMRAWLLASLAFDPSRNGTALMHEFLVGFYGEHAAPLVMRHMQVWRDAVFDSSPSKNCHDSPGAHICPRKLTKIDNATALWVTPSAILESAAALKEALAAAPPKYRQQIDRLWLSTRFVLLYNWNVTCALAKKQGIVWPVAPVLEGVVGDMEASLANNQIILLDYQRHGPSWLRNGSKLDLSLRCE